MLLPVVTFLTLVVLAYWRIKGPVWVVAIAWLVATVPVASEVAQYGFFKPSLDFDFTLIGYISCFVLGSIVYRSIAQRTASDGPPSDAAACGTIPLDDISKVLPTARLCWWIGVVGVILLVIDFRIKGISLTDLSAVRQALALQVLGSKSSFSIYAQLGNAMSWACLYSYLFSMAYWNELSRQQLFWFLSPVAGFFLVGLLVAGRETAFQIVLATLLCQLILQKRKITMGSNRSLMLVGGSICVLMIAYMGFIASARDAGLVSDDHSIVLRAIFDYSVDPSVERFQNLFSMPVKSFLNEAIVYFSSSVPLFKTFLTLKFSHYYYYGAFTFPFFMRQLQPISHISVTDALNTQYAAMAAAGVIPTGWVTALASYILDFGYIGAGVFLFLLGLYSEHAWKRGVLSGDFHDVVIATMMLITAAYMPMFPGTAETSIFFCVIFSLFVKFVSRHPPPTLVLRPRPAPA